MKTAKQHNAELVGESEEFASVHPEHAAYREEKEARITITPQAAQVKPLPCKLPDYPHIICPACGAEYDSHDPNHAEKIARHEAEIAALKSCLRDMAECASAGLCLLPPQDRDAARMIIERVRELTEVKP